MADPILVPISIYIDKFSDIIYLTFLCLITIKIIRDLKEVINAHEIYVNGLIKYTLAIDILGFLFPGL